MLAPPHRGNGAVTNNDRLDSWKEIAAYLKRGVRTVQRWERVAGLPVRRVPSTRGAVYAFRAELDQWWRTQSVNRAAAMTASLPSPAVSAARPQAPDPPAIAAPRAASMRVRPFIPQTLGIDPDSPTAHANLAVYFFTLVAMGMLRPDEGMPRPARQRSGLSSSTRRSRKRTRSPAWWPASTSVIGQQPSSGSRSPYAASPFPRRCASTMPPGTCRHFVGTPKL